MADTPANPLPGYQQISDGVYSGKFKTGQTAQFRGYTLTIVSDGNTGKYQIKVDSDIYIKGGSNGFEYNPDNKEDIKALLDYPEFKKTLDKFNLLAAEQNKYYVENNGTLEDNEKNQILNTDYYGRIRSRGRNAEGDITGTRALTDIEIPATNASQNFGNMRYPINSAGKDLDYIKFEIFDPVPSKFDLSERGNPGQFIDKQYAQKGVGIIYLPIQPNINDNNEVGWGDDNLSLVEMVAANLSLGFTGGTASTIEEIFKDIPNQIGKNAAAVEAAIRAFTAGTTLTKSEGNIFTRTTGAMLNPNLELIFNSPKLRQFKYNIKFIPRSQKEGNMVRKIIRAFKQNMAPRVAASNYFIQTPHVFSIDYLFNGKEPHRGLNKIKKCALTTCTVNYTPGNNYMPYTDGTMTSYELQLQFQELDPIYDEDYMINSDIKLSNDEIKQEYPPKISIGY